MENDRFSELAALGPNWDSYGALPISPVALRNAALLVRAVSALGFPAPEVIPVCDGSVDVDWDHPVGSLTIHVFPDGSAGIYALSPDGLHWATDEARGGEGD